ncbi:sugar-binding domain-containing protein [Propionimicrobium sp. PCR01-08-3]|uniref:sugar-binding transcriptional regulator n=1 Tax=Propionimicrobium sp. PCR01-08-3 TaxID=3052086 RepID=UPI00255CDD22|nr:sugar-binding domain-containing protein [Propionimicrobium sp. PCR01-08-3]WIY83239.1 sugar-binding domain-containing protein [Propionimicrobium sp. PCR01-08-3]
MVANLSDIDTQQLRQMARVARLHYEEGLRQNEIAFKLSLSPSKVSRLLKRAASVGVVQTIVRVPDGVHAGLEEELEGKYGLSEAVVTDAQGSHSEVLPSLADAGSAYLETTLISPVILGVSAWSETLMSVTNRLTHGSAPRIRTVVQLDGGVGHSETQLQSARMLERLAAVSDGEPVMVQAPGVASSKATHDAWMREETVRHAMGLWGQAEVALLGIGALHRSELVRSSGNYARAEDVTALAKRGAVGDVCLRYFDSNGDPVASSFDERVVGVTLAELRQIPRRIAVAGGAEKITAIRAALRGGIITTLVTDLGVARELAAD